MHTCQHARRMKGSNLQRKEQEQRADAHGNTAAYSLDIQLSTTSSIGMHQHACLFSIVACTASSRCRALQISQDGATKCGNRLHARMCLVQQNLLCCMKDVHHGDSPHTRRQIWTLQEPGGRRTHGLQSCCCLVACPPQLLGWKMCLQAIPAKCLQTVIRISMKMTAGQQIGFIPRIAT